MPIKFELKPEEQGVRQYKLRVRPFEGEIDRRDNEKTAKVEIIDRRTKVLLIAGGPMRDFIFLRNQLFRDKEIISDVWLQSGKPGISQEANEILYKFPETRTPCSSTTRSSPLIPIGSNSTSCTSSC